MSEMQLKRRRHDVHHMSTPTDVRTSRTSNNSHPTEVFAVKLASTGEENGSRWHVESHRKRLCGKQRLQQMSQS